MRTAVGPDGEVLVTDLGNARVQRWSELVGWIL